MSTVEAPSFVREDLLWEPAPVGAPARLRASSCGSCGRVEFPALGSCPACGASPEVIALGPAAVLRGCTEVLHAPPDALVEVPYTIAVAGFPAANLAVMGLLDAHVPVGDLTLGDPLEVCVVGYGDRAVYGFRLP